jgi:hypothetical protein
MSNDQFIEPYPISNQNIDISWMVGQAFNAVTYSEPNMWYFMVGNNASIGVECLWRIVEKDRIILTNEDHGQQFGLPEPIDAAAKGSELLFKRKILAVKLRDFTAEIVFQLESNSQLEIIPTSSGYESWRINTPFGISYFAQGGGQICEWKSENS